MFIFIAKCIHYNAFIVRINNSLFADMIAEMRAYEYMHINMCYQHNIKKNNILNLKNDNSSYSLALIEQCVQFMLLIFCSNDI